MARTKKVKEDDPLKAIRDRIAAAEKAHLPVGRESIALDTEGYENLALCIERGLGKKVDVLREALATGLRVMVKGTDPDKTYFETYGDAEPGSLPGETHTNGQPLPRDIQTIVEQQYEVPHGQPILTPLSVMRRAAEGEQNEEDENA